VGRRKRTSIVEIKNSDGLAGREKTEGSHKYWTKEGE